MNIYVDTPVHDTPKHCIGDRCEDEASINGCLATCEYCTRCRGLISTALQRGRISPRECGAIHPILDSAAERRRLFVLMPFARPFDPIYATVKDVSGRCHWSCARADDILHTRDIISVIWEEIERSECVIADVTGNNANVFYELGYAHAVGKNTISSTQNLAALPFDQGTRVVVEGQVDCNRAQGPRRSIGTPSRLVRKVVSRRRSTWLSHLLAEPDGPRVDEGTFSTPTLFLIYAAVASILSLANPKRLGDRSLLGGPAPVRQLARLKAIYPPRESVGSVCACEQVTGTSARYACSEEHDHECKPSPHRHTSASTSAKKRDKLRARIAAAPATERAALEARVQRTYSPFHSMMREKLPRAVV